MRRRTQFWMILALLLAVPPIYARGIAGQAAQSTAAEAGQAAGQTAATQDPNYKIGPQDVLDINVWKEPELTRAVPVRPDGKISLPLLSDVQAAGLTPTQLAAKLTTDLMKFVTNPQVTVIVAQINSQRVYILGEVGRAGAYPLLPQMTVLQALSSAGGLGQFANSKKIYVLRQVNGKPERYPFNYKDVLGGKRADENIQLKAGDTIVVP
ncbi:MAG TPA: polysaccharide biosynthesis/export family protein [Terriglobia bacterium]|nr:polysaccharide biosynthesis/export family protein [Terriglobia bacterium]HEV3481783.1 polysaccharide biosynthesis/export family protein [Candidatus Acidoferrales bacterium]